MKREKSKSRPPILQALKATAAKVEHSKTLRPGDIVLQLSGEGGGRFCVSCKPGSLAVKEAAGLQASAPPLFEVLADAEVVRDILEGRKDAVKAFIAGGIRIRGDLRYFSDLALELKLIDRPL